MAQVFPSRLPDEIRKDHKRSAECRVYDCLRDQLGPDYSVFYSSPWLGTMPDGSETEGEADFIVANPSLGILVIEVKGGRISIDADGQWRSKDRDGFTFKIKNPVKQARDSKHELRKKLKKSPRWNGGWITDRHGVILPDVERPERDLRPDMPRHIFAFSEDMAYLDQWIRSRFSRPDEDDRGPAGRNTDPVPALQDLLVRPIQLRVRLRADVSRDLHEINLLTEEQIYLLRELEGNARMAIAGAAGTGKTVLAVHKALALAEDGKRVLLLCYNRPLAAELRRMTGGAGHIEAMTFHQFCYKCAARVPSRTDISADEIIDSDSRQSTDELVELFADSGIGDFDSLIIDEGQDFRDSWLEALETVIRGGPDGVLYIFYDDNQNVMRRSREYLNSLPLSKYRLSRNLRNTKAIFREGQRFYSGEFVRPVGPEGVEVRWLKVQPSEFLKRLAERVGDLTANEGIAANHIAILAADNGVLGQITANGRIGRFKVTDAENEFVDRITVDTVRRFKGLESPVVLLVLTSELQDEMDLLYTGITRAQSILEIIGPPSILDRIRKQVE